MECGRACLTTAVRRRMCSAIRFMRAANPATDSLFDGGPPSKIEHRLGLVKPDDPRIARRASLVVLIGWFPLLVLSTVQEILLHNGSLRAFMLDFGAYGRFLIAAPLFIMAESSCVPALGRITRHFLDSGIVRDRDRLRFERALRSTRRLLNSTLAEILTVVFAYGAVAALRASAHTPTLPQWSVQQQSQGFVLSAAGHWQAWVSLPLLLILFFGWMWRQLLWCQLMLRIARLDLKLIAAHPDGAGGLKFVGTALRGYQPFVFALATIVAGGLANQIRAGASLGDLRFFVAGIAVFVVVVFVGPFVVFTPALRRLKDRGTLEYGALSCDMGHEFESKWMKNGGSNVKTEALEAPDFSATTDLYSISSNVYKIRYLPVDPRGIVELIVFTLLPFVPLVLMVVPMQVLLKGLRQILF